MNNLVLEILFWTILTLYVLTKFGVFSKKPKKSYKRKKK